MRVRMINKSGHIWDFNSMKAAKPHIKKANYDCYTIVIEDGEKIRIYDDRIS